MVESGGKGAHRAPERKAAGGRGAAAGAGSRAGRGGNASRAAARDASSEAGAGTKRAARKTTTTRAAAKKSAAGEEAGGKAAGGRAAGGKAAGEKGAGKEAAGAQAAARKTAKSTAVKRRPAGRKTTGKAAGTADRTTGEAAATADREPSRPRARKAATTDTGTIGTGTTDTEHERKTGARPVVAKKRATAVSPVSAAGGVPKARPADVEPGVLPVRTGEDPWSDEEVTELRAGLLEDVERLRAEISTAERAISGLLRDSGGGAGDDDADTGTKNISREHEMALANNAREMLRQTEHALERLETGTYGYCESCGNPIGKARLQAFPRATLCVECKQRQERR
jgi:RNA polymerase-binding protein DksA